MSRADYKVFIDWDGDNGLALSNFEGGADGWYADGTTPPNLRNLPAYNPATEAAHRFRDDFSDPDTLGSQNWPTFDNAVAISSDTMVIGPGTAGMATSYVQSKPLLVRNSYVQARVVVPSMSTTDGRTLVFEVCDDSSNKYGFYWGDSESDTTTVVCTYTVAGSVEETDTFSYSASSGEFTYLRLREDEESLYWENSDNGFVWDELFRVDDHDLQLVDAYTEFRVENDSGSPDAASFLTVSEFNTAIWPVYTGANSLLVDFIAFNPFQFGVADHGFDDGRFGTVDFVNTSGGTPFEFDGVGAGFDDGRFTVADAGDDTLDFPAVLKELTGLDIGKNYTLSLWVYIPTGVTATLQLSIQGMATIVSSTSDRDEWQELSLDFTATATEHVTQLREDIDPLDSDMFWMDHARLISSDSEDVTERVFARTNLNWDRGRDSNRTLDKNSPAAMVMELDNRSLDYSPGNAASPVAGLVTPGKEVFVSAAFEGTEYPLYRGYIDDMTIRPFVMQQSVQVDTVDLLGYFGNTATTSTGLYKGIRTGEAFHKILDAINWPTDRRRIDPGSTVIPFWWMDNQNVQEAMNELQDSEGAPAICYVDGFGTFVFNDRHHRVLYPDSRTSQVNFVEDDLDETDESIVAYSPDFEYNIGWKDLINSATFEVDIRQPSSTYAEIYKSEDIISVQAGETKELVVSSPDPFYDAIAPIPRDVALVDAGTGETETTTSENEFIGDYDLTGNATVTLTGREGGSTTVRILGGAGGGSISNLSIRAINIPVVATLKISGTDSTSVIDQREQAFTDTPRWVNIHDALAIVNILLGLRAERLPVITFSVKNHNPARLKQILGRSLGDRVHIVEDATFTDADFYLERIEHNIAEAGAYHEATMGFEQARVQPNNVFTFDDADRGFDDGLFGYTGIDNPEQVFILGRSRLDQGLLGH